MELGDAHDPAEDPDSVRTGCAGRISLGGVKERLSDEPKLAICDDGSASFELGSASVDLLYR